MHFALFINIFQRNSNIHVHVLLNIIYFLLFFLIKRILKFSIKPMKIELSTQIKQWMYSIEMLQFFMIFYDCHNSKENINVSLPCAQFVLKYRSQLLSILLIVKVIQYRYHAICITHLCKIKCLLNFCNLVWINTCM